MLTTVGFPFSRSLTFIFNAFGSVRGARAPSFGGPLRSRAPSIEMNMVSAGYVGRKLTSFVSRNHICVMRNTVPSDVVLECVLFGPIVGCSRRANGVYGVRPEWKNGPPLFGWRCWRVPMRDDGTSGDGHSSLLAWRGECSLGSSLRYPPKRSPAALAMSRHRKSRV